MMDNSSTEALRGALRWQEYIAKAGKTPEQRERAQVRIERLKACIAVREEAPSIHTAPR
jgi:hypothetical protein